MSSWLREALRACGTFERLTFAYLGFLNGLILLFSRNVQGAPLHFFGHLALAAGVLALARAARRFSHPLLLFVRHWYPFVLFLFFFEELHGLVHLVFPGWFDGWLVRFDYALLGVHPTVWLEQFASPALNDLMQFAYMTYYFYGVILGAVLYHRHALREFWSVMASTAAAYYFGYVVSILLPIEGPHHVLAALHQTELTGGFFTSLINWIESVGRVHGAAFPSAHVSGSCVALLGAWRYRRWLFWVFLPFFGTMLVATVYGRYHYVADVLAGLLVAVVAFRAVGAREWRVSAC